MKFTAVITAAAALIGSAAALTTPKKATATFKKVTAPVKKAVASSPLKNKNAALKKIPLKKIPTPLRTAAFNAYGKFSGYSLNSIPGGLAPTGIWDPLGLASKADGNLLKRYREAELAHSRVAMLAVVGFLVGEWVEGSSFLFDASVSGPAITHLAQVPVPFWTILAFFIGYLELNRAEIGWVPPEDVPLGKPGLLRPEYSPGDLGFDPLKLKPSDGKAWLDLQNKELQNGRLAMLAAAGFMAQELVDGKGIFEHLFSA